jgi:hypothetical protein
VTEKPKETNQQEGTSEVSLTRSLGRFVGMLRLLPRLRSTRLQRGGLRDGRTWREGVFSLKYRRRNETNEYHPAQQSPHENDWLPGNKYLHGIDSARTKQLYCYFTAFGIWKSFLIAIFSLSCVHLTRTG